MYRTGDDVHLQDDAYQDDHGAEEGPLDPEVACRGGCVGEVASAAGSPDGRRVLEEAACLDDAPDTDCSCSAAGHPRGVSWARDPWGR